MVETDAPTCGTHNTVPSYLNKPTLVRAYVRADGVPPTRPMWGRLCLDSTGQCIRSLAPIQVQQDEDPVSVQQRGDLTRTLNFLLPFDYMGGEGGGWSDLTVYLNEDGAYVAETDYANNRKSFRTYFLDTETWEVRFIPVHANGFEPHGNPGAIATWLTKVYPINPHRLRIRLDGPIFGSWDFGAPPGFGLVTGCSAGWDNLTEQIAWRRWSDWRSGKINHYGMVNPAAIMQVAAESASRARPVWPIPSWR
jgi:hypothetical protein